MAIVRNNGVDGKICSLCRDWKSLNDFPHDKTHGPLQAHRHCRCKKCHSEVAKLKRKAL
jgi:hypothetical protein